VKFRLTARPEACSSKPHKACAQKTVVHSDNKRVTWGGGRRAMAAMTNWFHAQVTDSIAFLCFGTFFARRRANLHFLPCGPQ
jgi:hypothetical protein